MGFLVVYKGNTGGSVVIPDSPFREMAPRPVWYHCPYCEEAYNTIEELRAHRIDMHPLRRPYLMIKGVPIGRDELQLKRPLIAEELNLENAEKAFLDGVEYSDHEDLFDVLLANQNGRRILKLQYQEYALQVALTFNLISDETLRAVDRCFHAAFADQDVSTQLLRNFNVRLGDDARENAYAGGLGCYISGLMAKDRVPSTSLNFDQFNEKFGEALDHLETVDTELANSVSAVILFSRNQFTRSRPAMTLPQLSVTSEFMLDGKFRDFEPQVGAERALIPIDAMTDTLVLFCTKGTNYRSSCAKDLESLQKISTVSLEDREKALFALMCHYRETSNEVQATECFKKLKHSRTFADTAAKVMDISHA